jgi:sporulation protein YlmC with PRC-barrel domain
MNGQAKWARVSWMAAAVLPLVGGLTSAANLNNSARPQTNQPQQQDQQVATSPEQTAQFQPHLEKAKDLIGAKVVNDKGEQLGTIKDIVLTPDRGAVHYVVLGHDGTWGTGGKFFAVPWSKLSFKPGENENERLVVLTGVSRADLDQAKGFDKDNWPATASENWLGLERGSSMMPPASPPQPYVAPGATGTSGNTGSSAAQPIDIQSLRLSKILGEKVQDLQGENIGRLDNVMIDLHQGKLAFGIVSMRHGFLGLDKEFAAVPWTALDLASEPGIAKLNADRDTLAAIAFESDNFPNLADPQYSRQLFERFHATPYWEGQNLGYIPGEENPNMNPPAGMAPESSPKATAPNSNVTPSEMIGYRGKHPMAFNPYTVQTVHGIVQRVGTYDVEGTSAKGVLLRVRTDDGRTLWVQAGPRPYLDRHNLRFHRGDRITITGSAVIQGRHETFVASQIQTPNRVLDLRTADGRPLWNLDQYRMPSASGAYPYRGPYRY